MSTAGICSWPSGQSSASPSAGRVRWSWSHLSMHMAHQDACASGFFGLFAEETTVHIELGDTRRLKALLAAFKKSHSPEEGMKLRAYLSDGQALWEDISTFLSCVKTRWLKANDVFPRGFNLEPPHPSVRGNSKSQEIVATAPTLHLCRRRSPLQVQPAGGE